MKAAVIITQYTVWIVLLSWREKMTPVSTGAGVWQATVVVGL